MSARLSIARQTIAERRAVAQNLRIFAGVGSVAAYGLQGVLADPQLQVLNTGETNDQWPAIDDDSGSGTGLQEELAESGFSPSDTLESALWPTFTPGFYTVKLSGTNGSSGLGLIEFYEY